MEVLTIGRGVSFSSKGANIYCWKHNPFRMETIHGRIKKLLIDFKRPSNNDKFIDNNEEEEIFNDKEVVSILTDLTKELHDLKTLSEEDVAKIFDLIENSALLPYIESKLESCNFLEIERHSNVYG